MLGDLASGTCRWSFLLLLSVSFQRSKNQIGKYPSHAFPVRTLQPLPTRTFSAQHSAARSRGSAHIGRTLRKKSRLCASRCRRSCESFGLAARYRMLSQLMFSFASPFTASTRRFISPCRRLPSLTACRMLQRRTIPCSPCTCSTPSFRPCKVVDIFSEEGWPYAI